MYSKVSFFLVLAFSNSASEFHMGAILRTYTGLGVLESILISVLARSIFPKKGREYLT